MLNAGSNVGFHSVLASRLGHEVVSLDPSQIALRHGVQVKWIDEAVCGDVMNLPFRDGSFSNAIFSEVIEEIPSQARAIAELSRCSDRTIVTTSPIKSDVFYSTAKSIKRRLGRHPFEIAHVNELNPNALLGMLEKANLHVSEVSFHNPFHVWNLMALFPFTKELDFSPLDTLLGFASICSGVLCVADRQQPTR